MRIRPPPPTTPHQSPLQLRISLDSDVSQRLSTAERERAIAQLAILLLLAGGVTMRERNDDEQR